MPALQQYLNAEIDRRGWSVREFARRAKISLSNAYLIVRDGEDNVRRDTFENIASALFMSPAELAVAIGKGAATDDPKRVLIHAALRQVPDDQLETVELMIRGLAIQPAQRAKGRSVGSANGRKPSRAELLNGAAPRDPQERKRRQFGITGPKTYREHAVHAMQLLIAALSWNRDSGRVPVGA